jgi:hypothetical protein
LVGGEALFKRVAVATGEKSSRSGVPEANGKKPPLQTKKLTQTASKVLNGAAQALQVFSEHNNSLI